MTQPHRKHPQPATLGQLKKAGYRYRSVKQELRENLIQRMRDAHSADDADAAALFPGIRGYRHTVLPQIIHAVFSRHDMLFLGLRGQAKTRILRMLPSLLDEWCPVIAGLEIPDDPLEPMTSLGRRAVLEAGDDTQVRWLSREDRYHEKLATPDVTIADLIGEIDIVKHAEGRYLSDESTMHFGLIPRTNRGIFAINELPDLAPRIQVGLFNVLEERDVQIRGYPVRLNLDVCLVFSANPEDYTNRGRIVTPLKDRIGSVIRTHYPQNTAEAMRITKENAWLNRGPTAEQSKAQHPGDPEPMPTVEIPEYLHRIIEGAVAAARTSAHINQASGVSVRTSIACLETIVSSAERRGLLTGESRIVPRVCDLAHLHAATRGKIELMMAEEGDDTEDRLVTSLLGESVKDVFSAIADEFEGGLKLTVGDEVSATDQLASMRHVEGLVEASADLARRLELDPKDEQHLAGAGEFLLEVLYVHNLLSKHPTTAGSSYGR